MALRRSIARGCSTLLEASDDRDDSAGDFDVVFPNPRPNAITPTEEPCTSQSRAAQTTLRRKPAKRTRDRTPTFRFTSNDDATTFQCKVDGAKFRPCRSPFTARRLSFGKHTFRVRARGLSGDVDPSPAAYSFTVLR
jgi:hypothetical protein